MQISTKRVLLRPFTHSDTDAFAELNADPAVMDWLGGPLSRAQSDALLDRLIVHHERHGFAPWCVELDRQPIGWCGLLYPAFRPEVEIGWRLRSDQWGHGYATEAAVAALADGFDRLDIGEVISFTAASNRRSRAVMERIGLKRDRAEDFLHPSFAPTHRLAPHVLYRTTRQDWMPPTPYRSSAPE